MLNFVWIVSTVWRAPAITNGMFHSLGAKIFAKAAVSFAEP